MKRSAVLAAAVLAAALLGPLGADAAKPPKPGPNQVTLTASAPIVTFGQKDTLSGQVKGSKTAGVSVQLQQLPAPYTGGYKNVSGATAATDAAGKFSFTVQPPVSTRYRAVAKTSPQSMSPELTVPVRFKVTLKLSDYTPDAGDRVRFSGNCAPAHDGATVYIQRRTAPGKYRTVAKTTLKHATSGDLSTFSRRIKVSSSGVFRARVLADNLHATGTSRTKRATIS